MIYFKYIQTGFNNFSHGFDITKSHIAFTSFVAFTDGYKDNGPSQMNTFFNMR